MSKRLFTVFSLLVIASMMIAACTPKPAATEAPHETAAPTDAPAMYECTDAFGCVVIAPDEPIHIAYWGVLTTADATLGQDSLYGVEVAVDDAGGKLLGHDILLTSEDAGCTPETGATAASKLATDTSLVGLVGPNCTDEVYGGIAAITAAGMTTISPSATRAGLTVPDRSPDYAGFLRTAHSDYFQGRLVAEFAYNTLHVTKLATIHDGSGYAQGLVGVTADRFKELGGTVVSEQAVAKTDTDMHAVLTTIAAAGAEMIYYPIFLAGGGYITSQVREVAGLETAILMGSDGLFSPDLLKGAGANAEGMYLSSPDFSLYPKAGYDAFVAKYKAKSGGTILSIFHANAYDAAGLLLAAIAKVAVVEADGTIYVPRQALRDAVYATKDYVGITGSLSCNATGDCGALLLAVYQIVDASPDSWDPGVNPKVVFP